MSLHQTGNGNSLILKDQIQLRKEFSIGMHVLMVLYTPHEMAKHTQQVPI